MSIIWLAEGYQFYWTLWNTSLTLKITLRRYPVCIIFIGLIHYNTIKTPLKRVDQVGYDNLKVKCVGLQLAHTLYHALGKINALGSRAFLFALLKKGPKMLVCVNLFFCLLIEWRGLPGFSGLRPRMPPKQKTRTLRWRMLATVGLSPYILADPHCFTSQP